MGNHVVTNPEADPIYRDILNDAKIADDLSATRNPDRLVITPDGTARGWDTKALTGSGEDTFETAMRNVQKSADDGQARRVSVNIDAFPSRNLDDYARGLGEHVEQSSKTFLEEAARTGGEMNGWWHNVKEVLVTQNGRAARVWPRP